MQEACHKADYKMNIKINHISQDGTLCNFTSICNLVHEILHVIHATHRTVVIAQQPAETGNKKIMYYVQKKKNDGSIDIDIIWFPI